MKNFEDFKKSLVRATLVTMVSTLVVGVYPLSVHAATTGKITADLLNVRSGAGTNYARVTQIRQGASVNVLETVTGTDGYKWYKISGAASGYVRSDFVSDVVSDQAAPTKSSSGTVTADTLNVRTGPGQNYSRINYVTQGTRVTIISVHGSWYKITCKIGSDYRTGYVHSDYIKLDGTSNNGNSTNSGNSSSQNNSSSNSQTTETVIAKGVVNVSALNVRKSASTSDTVLGVIRQNQTVEILSQSGSWYKVRCTVNGSTQTGFVYAEYITKTQNSNSSGSTNTNTQQQASGKGVVNCDALNVRSGAGTNNSKIGLIMKNTQVDILSQVGSWYKISYTSGGTKKEGYVSAEYITKIATTPSTPSTTPTETKPAETTPAETEPPKQEEPTPEVPDSQLKKGKVNADWLNVRTGPSTSANRIGMIAQGTAVTILSQEGQWYKISCMINGTQKEGYVSVEFITIVTDSDNNSNNNNSNSGNTGSDTTIAGKTATLTGSGVNLRTGPGTGYNSYGMMTLGTLMTVQSKEGEWYKVSCIINGTQKTGYVYGEYVKILGENDTPYEGVLDSEFEEQIAKFPESYKNALRHLHAKYPKWNFEAKYVDLDFNQSVDTQETGKRSMIYCSNSTPFSWLSTLPAYYDWSTDVYDQLDGPNWKAASRDLIAYYMDPRNFLDEQQIFMFESQSYENSQNRQVVAGILSGTFMANGKTYTANGKTYQYVDTFMEAGQIAKVSPYFLASRCRQEVGSTEANMGSNVSGNNAYGVYNFFNIGAYASAEGNAVTNGLIYASANNASFRRPWKTPWLAIVGGAEFLSESYIARGQDTDYFQKFNVVSQPYHGHQYMGNIQAPCSEGSNRYSTYKDLGILNSEFTFTIPVYDNMPEQASKIPVETGNPNSYIKYLSVSNMSLNSTFKYNKQTYYGVTNQSSITISATPVSSYGKIISGAGTHSLKQGQNVIEVVCQAGNGTKTTYTLTITRQ